LKSVSNLYEEWLYHRGHPFSGGHSQFQFDRYGLSGHGVSQGNGIRQRQHQGLPLRALSGDGSSIELIGRDNIDGDFCRIWANPAAKWRLRVSASATHVKLEAKTEAAKVRIGQQKQKKK
jgi:hypothetical protein